MLDDLIDARRLAVVVVTAVPVLVVVATVVLAQLRERRPATARAWLLALTAVCLGAVALLTLPPRQGTPHVRVAPVLDPWTTLQHVFAGDGRREAVAFALANLLMLFPLGCFLGLLVRPWWALLLVLATSVAIETLQWLMAVGREPDAADVLLNTVGGAVGVLVAATCAALSGRQSRR